jgi:hypothetical protein
MDEAAQGRRVRPTDPQRPAARGNTTRWRRPMRPKTGAEDNAPYGEDDPARRATDDTAMTAIGAKETKATAHSATKLMAGNPSHARRHRSTASSRSDATTRGTLAAARPLQGPSALPSASSAASLQAAAPASAPRPSRSADRPPGPSGQGSPASPRRSATRHPWLPPAHPLGVGSVASA